MKLTSVKQLLFTNWHSMRWIRLLIAIFFIQQAIYYQLATFAFIAAFFLFQVVFNTGCKTNGCQVDYAKKRQL